MNYKYASLCHGNFLLMDKQTSEIILQIYAALSKKGKVFPYSLPIVAPGADPGVQAVVSPQVTWM